MMPKLLLTPKEAAAMLGTSQEMLDALRVPFVTIHGRGTGLRTHRRYSRPALLAWLSGNTQVTVAAPRAQGAR